jgi:DNA-binding transcriptional ArsR family regulator
MAGSPDTLYSMQVEELASAIGTRPRLVIYHLEKLQEWGLVEVKKARKYGRKERRSIWGLDMRNPVRLRRIYAVLDDFFNGRVSDARTHYNYSKQKQQLPV